MGKESWEDGEKKGKERGAGNSKQLIEKSDNLNYNFNSSLKKGQGNEQSFF